MPYWQKGYLLDIKALDDDGEYDDDTIAEWERRYEGPVNSEGRITLQGGFNIRYVHYWLVFTHFLNILVVAYPRS